MAEMTIRLRVNPETGKKDIIVALRSDEDALPHEHEQLHRKLVEQLIASGLLSEAEQGKLVVERLEEEGVPNSTPAAAREQTERRSLSEGS
ncbi:MAG: hypothetical protein ACTHK7_01250 [Aureliella sp.]